MTTATRVAVQWHIVLLKSYYVMQSSTMKHVKNSQGVQLASLARDYHVPREQFAGFLKDPARLEKFFNDIKGINPWFEKIQKEAEKIGAKVFLIEKLPVNYGRSHNEAALAGRPQTPGNYNVLKVGDRYTLPESTLVHETVVMLNYPQGGGNYEKTVEWGIKQGLRKSNPHVSFAVGEVYPKLNYELGPNPMYAVETTGCSFGGDPGACYVWWDGAKRRADLGWRSNFGDSCDWFVFCK